MSWRKVSDDLHSHPKFGRVSLAARGLWVTCLSWTGQHTTDGVVPEWLIVQHSGTRSKTLTEELTVAGLWDRTDAGEVVFHDYAHYQPSGYEEKQYKEARFKARSEAGKRNAEKRWHKENDTNPDANSMPNSMPTPCQTDTNSMLPSPSPSPESSPLRSEEEPPKRAQKRASPPKGDAPETFDLCGTSSVNPVALFAEAFKAQTGESPHILPRFAKGLKDLLGTIREEHYERALAGFFSDGWAAEKGFSVSVFLSQSADRWIGARVKSPPPPPGVSASQLAAQQESDRLRAIIEKGPR